MSINKNDIENAIVSLKRYLIMNPKNGREIYEISKGIIANSILANLEYTDKIFNPIVGIESELSGDGGEGLFPDDPIFEAYTKALGEAQATIYNQLFSEGADTV